MEQSTDTKSQKHLPVSRLEAFEKSLIEMVLKEPLNSEHRPILEAQRDFFSLALHVFRKNQGNSVDVESFVRQVGCLGVGICMALGLFLALMPDEGHPDFLKGLLKDARARQRLIESQTNLDLTKALYEVFKAAHIGQEQGETKH